MSYICPNEIRNLKIHKMTNSQLTTDLIKTAIPFISLLIVIGVTIIAVRKGYTTGSNSATNKH